MTSLSAATPPAPAPQQTLNKQVKSKAPTTITKTPAVSTQQPKTTPAVELTFIQVARSGIIARDVNNRGKFTLTLKGIDPEVVYMSDRAAALSGKTSIQQFIGEWKSQPSNLKPERPNALLVTKMSKTAKDNQSYENMVILSNPRYTDGSKSLTYDIEIVDKSQTLHEGSIREPVLFIESSCTSFCR
jgi:hypothetical protein